MGLFSTDYILRTDPTGKELVFEMVGNCWNGFPDDERVPLKKPAPEGDLFQQTWELMDAMVGKFAWAHHVPIYSRAVVRELEEQRRIGIKNPMVRLHLESDDWRSNAPEVRPYFPYGTGHVDRATIRGISVIKGNSPLHFVGPVEIDLDGRYEEIAPQEGVLFWGEGASDPSNVILAETAAALLFSVGVSATRARELAPQLVDIVRRLPEQFSIPGAVLREWHQSIGRRGRSSTLGLEVSVVLVPSSGTSRA